jgi:hypothetical protein
MKVDAEPSCLNVSIACTQHHWTLSPSSEAEIYLSIFGKKTVRNMVESLFQVMESMRESAGM